MRLIRSHPLWALIAIGVTIRLVLAFAFFGNPDIHVWQWVDYYLDRDPLGIYGEVNGRFGGGFAFAWPYPPPLLAWIELASGLSDVTGLPFHGVIQLLPIAADVGIAYAIYVYLGWRRAREGQRLAGAALVMLGPCFIAISGYHGQFDQVAILPAVLALMAWERGPVSRRALGSGVLVGLGAAMKTVPLLIVLPLLTSSRSRNERAKLVAAALAVPLLAIAPFLVSDTTAVLDLRHYQGLPGLGGLSLVTDPSSASAWIVDQPVLHDRGAIGTFVTQHAGAITLLALLGLVAFLVRYRPAPIDGAVLLWLTIYAFSPNFLMQYLLWGLPFFIMAGYLREVAILQAALMPALVIAYLIPFSDSMPWAAVYTPSMICLWALWVAALVAVARHVVRQRPVHPTGVQAPLVGPGVDRREAATEPLRPVSVPRS